MKPNDISRRWIIAALYILTGIILTVCGQMEMVDEFWSGMGMALIFVGALRMFRLIRYTTDSTYKEQTDTARQDERNRFLGMKAWSWAGYLYMILAGLGTVLFKVLEMEDLMFAASGSVCVMLTLYWVSYLILRKKY